MDGSFTVRGVVATRPRHVVTAEGLAVTSFRLLSRQATGAGSRTWFTVSALRRLAIDAARALEPGDAVLVAGRLVIHSGVSPGALEGSESAGDSVAPAGESGAVAEVEAEAIGRELGCGRRRRGRTDKRKVSEAEETPGPVADASGALRGFPTLPQRRADNVDA